MKVHGLSLRQGLYDPSYEHDNCGLGFIVDRKGRKEHRIVSQALQLLCRLKHRGATGSDGTTGDGAGILIQIPHEFLAGETKKLGFTLPVPGNYALGMTFLPREPHSRLFCEGLFERIASQEGLPLLGWREVPVDETACGTSGRASRPAISQIFLARGNLPAEEFERKLLLVRKKVQKEVASSDHPYTEYFYICSLSPHNLVYKGQVLGEKLSAFYPDLADSRVGSALAIVHERYSTNTFPQWRLAHPFRLLAHNGEINTLRGNVNWMNAREPFLCRDHPGFKPVIEPGGSDSATLDNVLELLIALGHPLEKAMMILVPEAWQDDLLMEEKLKAFYEFHALQMEPWDGPAALVFTDGTKVGARADRNGLRPLRFTETRDGLVVMASETGTLDLPAADILRRGILGPGQMLLVDTSTGDFLGQEEILRSVTSGLDHPGWLKRNRRNLDDLPGGEDERRMNAKLLAIRKRCFGFSERVVRDLLVPMARKGREPLGSMGDDRPIAALSEAAKPFCDYFRQAFAQVTNPPIDPIRERSVMSLKQYLGGQQSLSRGKPLEADHPFLELESPILDNRQMAILRGLDGDPLRSTVLPITFSTDGGQQELEQALQTLCQRAERCVLEGFDLLILSDRNIGLYSAPMPCLLALGAVHQHLVRKRLRTRVDLVVEAGGIVDVMHMALLLGYGAKAVNPYLALETLRHMETREQGVNPLPPGTARANYIGALNKGLLKIMGKMGISTLQSYHGAQIFEVLGLSRELVHRHFTGTPVALSGIGLDTIYRDLVQRHSQAYLDGALTPTSEEEPFLLNMAMASLLREACRTGSHAAYREFSEKWETGKRHGTLRGLLERVPGTPVPLDEVEAVESLFRRFTTGAISLGAISRECHETLAAAMNCIGGRSNSGEGGEEPQRDRPATDGNTLRSAVRQVASGRFGVDIRYLTHCDEIQIKMGQGAKPGEGGHLPGKKVSTDVARLRHCKPGQSLISPPPHHDIYSIEDLAQLIHDLKRANPKARISVKLAARTGIGTIAAGVVKARADAIILCGHDGGTGAAPVSSMHYVGLPWEIGLAEIQQTLLLNDLRDRVSLQVDGRMVTGHDVVTAALLGAEEFGFTSASLIASGCLMCRQCSRNACPVGIATQDEARRNRFPGRPEEVINFFRFVAGEVREIMAELGFRRLDDLIGRVDLLRPRQDLAGKETSLELAPLLYRPELPSRIGRRKGNNTPWAPPPGLDEHLLDQMARQQESFTPIANTDRSVGAHLSGVLEEHHEKEHVTTKTFVFAGTAGQSFGAFLRSGLTFRLEGDSNDYLGKGLSGGTIIVYPPEKSAVSPSEHVIAGNTLLYGATAGEAYLNGKCGERFAVRNSGAVAVCEGIGNHGCEYMTGGIVVILGPVGNNFGAGMTGGEAFILDRDGNLGQRCHPMGLVMQEMTPSDPGSQRLRRLIEKHHKHTESPVANQLLQDWEKALPLFRLITPAPPDIS